MTGHAEQVIKLAEAGAGAIVLKSIFEEEIFHELQEELSLRTSLNSDPEYLDYFDYVIKEETIRKYLHLFLKLKQKLRFQSLPALIVLVQAIGHYLHEKLKKLVLMLWS